MATLALPSPPQSPTTRRRPKKWARKCERYCCLGLTYFPLGFVYGLTTWAVWVEATIGFRHKRSPGTGPFTSFLGIALYLLLNWCYTTAVFVDPGSPLSSTAGYSRLPTQEPQNATSFTVKSTGGTRFCKKCQTRKPDRVHHCSTCKRCVLKMDHHCPWLATCVGLGNYKAFLLFLIYTSLFCWVCFFSSAGWVWNELIVDGPYTEDLMPVNYVVLAVLSGIIGIVLAGFTAWHLSLAWQNQTTIERLEKTRYLSPLRRSMQQQSYQSDIPNGNFDRSYGQQLREIHANVLPGVTRPEEGEERHSPVERSTPSIQPHSVAQESLRRNYNDMERSRERLRYEDYLDEKDSEKLPNAFDLGWRRNLLHLFGERPLFWFFPICNTTGDGWHWEPSPTWLAAREDVRREREEEWKMQHQAQQGQQPGPEIRPQQPSRHYLATGVRGSPSGSQRPHGPSIRSLHVADGRAQRNDEDGYDTSSDEEAPARLLRQAEPGREQQQWRDWDGRAQQRGQQRPDDW